MGEADLAFDSAKDLAEQPTDAEVAAVGGVLEGGGVVVVVVVVVVVIVVVVVVGIVEWW